jgi:hypothetical protein
MNFIRAIDKELAIRAAQRWINTGLERAKANYVARTLN